MSPSDPVNIVYNCMLGGVTDFLVKPVRKNEPRDLWQHVWRRHSVSSDEKRDFSQKQILRLSVMVVLGLSIHTTPVEMREKLAIPESEWPRAIVEFVDCILLKRLVFLAPVIAEVSAGLDSLVLGEGQILDQVKAVIKYGEGVTGFKRNISGLFKHAITVGKRVRSETDIESGAVFVSSAAVELATVKHPERSSDNARILVVRDLLIMLGSYVSDAANSRLYSIDDLKEVVAANKEDRLCKAMEAQSIITEESKQFRAWRDSLEAIPTIKKLRALVDGIRITELERCLLNLGDDMPKKARKVIEDLSHGITNKMLHGPMQYLRCDGSESRTLSETIENMQALNRIFNLETDVAVLEQKVCAKVEQSRREA